MEKKMKSKTKKKRLRVHLKNERQSYCELIQILTPLAIAAY